MKRHLGQFTHEPEDSSRYEDQGDAEGDVVPFGFEPVIVRVLHRRTIGDRA